MQICKKYPFQFPQTGCTAFFLSFHFFIIILFLQVLPLSSCPFLTVTYNLCAVNTRKVGVASVKFDIPSESGQKLRLRKVSIKGKAIMENRHGLFRQTSGYWRSLRDGDFEEGDVWAILRDTTDSTPMVAKSNEIYVSVHRPVPSAARMIPRATGSSSSSNNSSHEAKLVQQSAPVNVPDWSQMSRRKSKKAAKNDSWHDDEDDDDDDEASKDAQDSDEDDKDNEHICKLPPHELIARRLAKSHISSFSVFEGVGRTLKGRDLSKVRNAVLTKTGFLE